VPLGLSCDDDRARTWSTAGREAVRIRVSSGREHAVPGRNEGVDAHRLGVRHEDFPHERPGRPDMVHAPPQSPPGEPDSGSRRPEHLLADPVQVRLLRSGPTPNGDPPLVCPTCAAPIGGGTEQLLAALAASESRFRAAFADAGVGMALIGTDDRIIEANPALAAMLGRDADELGDLNVHELIDSEDAPHHLFKELADGAHGRLSLERRLRHRTGRSVWSKVTLSLVRDSAGNPLSTLAVVEDVTERRMLGDRLAYQSLHDPLTRLPNRTLFFERLEAAFLGAGGTGDADRTGDAASTDDRSDGDRPGALPDGTAGFDGSDPGVGPAGVREPASGPGSAGGRARGADRIGLCYLDLDSFAAINETLGHHVGDQLLVAVAARLEQDFGQDEDRLVARLGGDEFAVLVTGSQGTDQLTSLAARLVESLERPFEAGGHHLVVTASVGVVERPVGGTSPTDLLKDADSTLYWSKADGRARWTLYDPARGAHQLTTQRLATALRPALERGEFAVEYQPLVGLADGLVHGAEALVRWRHPRYGTLSPDRFIPLAEESGAIVPLGKWVLEESCRQARQWLADFPDLEMFVSVNLAARQIWDSDVVADVADVLDRTGLPARLLQLEITESALLGPGGRPLQALQALADMGIRIAIDDFGTGYSNLSYLSRLPVHVLKLDGSFIESFRDPAGSAAPGTAPGAGRRTDADEQIVGAMVRLAHALGLSVTAEGIENAAQAERLRLTGCDTAQGWYFARPGDADRVSAMLREGRSRADGSAERRPVTGTTARP
jgi:diguanylate cyclase (GGDEF)-like protein/PAS domain S-box-containing protein